MKTFIHNMLFKENRKLICVWSFPILPWLRQTSSHAALMNDGLHKFRVISNEYGVGIPAKEEL